MLNHQVRFLRHESCPACGSKDNLGVWDDGHKYCFGCKHTVKSETADKYQLPVQVETITQHQGQLAYPSDATSILPVKAYKALARHGITTDEIVKYRIQWSEIYNRILFSYRSDDGTLKAWQGRWLDSIDVPKSPNSPKWFNMGNIGDLLWIVGKGLTKGKNCDTIVVVEDILSAIKVARYMPATPLFGTTFPQSHMHRLAKAYQHIAIWLDEDRHHYAQNLSRQANLYFGEGYVSVISTYKDPKDLDLKEIISNLQEDNIEY